MIFLQVDELFQALAGVKVHFVDVCVFPPPPPNPVGGPFGSKRWGGKRKKRIPDKQWKSPGCFGDIGDDITHLYGLHWAIIRIPISQPGLMECNKVVFWVSNEGDEKTSKPPFFKKPDMFRLFMKELLLDLIGYVKSHQSCNAHFRWLNDLYNYIRWYHIGLVCWMCFHFKIYNLQLQWCLKGEET